MSEQSIPTNDVPTEHIAATEHTAAPSVASTGHGVEPHAAALPVATSRVTSTPEAEALLEIIRRGLAPEADASARATAAELCARVLQALSPPPPPVPAVVFTPLAPAPTPPVGFVPTMPATTPTSPFAAMVGNFRNMPPEQLVDLAIQRLRAALPAGVTVPEPKGIQFQLVPVTPPGGRP